MGRSCSIKNCKSVWLPNSEISYYSFPTKNALLREMWIKAIPHHLLPKLTKNTFICSKHFDAESFKKTTGLFRNGLKNGAVPSLFEVEIKDMGDKVVAGDKVTKLGSVIKEKFSEIVKSGKLSITDVTTDNEYRNVLPMFKKEMCEVITKQTLPESDVVEKQVESPKEVRSTTVSSTMSSSYTLNNRCRLCFNPAEKMYPIHNLKLLGSGDISLSFCSIIRRYVPFQIYLNDGKPQNICDLCVLYVCQSHNFFDMCIRTNNKLDHMANQLYNVMSERTEEYIHNENLVNKISPQKIKEGFCVSKDDEIAATSTKSFDNSKQDFSLAAPSQKSDAECKHNNNNMSVSSSEEIIEHGTDNIKFEQTENDNVSVNSVDMENIILSLKQEEEVIIKHENDNIKFTMSEKTENDNVSVNNDMENILRVKQEESSKLCKSQISIKEQADRMFGRIVNKKMNVISKNLPSQGVCTICKTTIGDFDDVVCHYETSHPLNPKCILCGKTFSATSLTWMKCHLRKHRKKELWCDICKMFFISIAEKTEHLKNGHRDPLTCHLCDRRFKSRLAKREHIMASHTNIKSHICSICSKGFAYQNNLDRHVFVKHRGRRFMCPECNLPLTSFSHLKSHAFKTHGMDLSQDPNARKVEFIRVDNNSEPQPNSCGPVSECLTCKYCQRKCRSKSHYLSHQRTHLDGSSWPCKVCAMLFDDKKTRQDHMDKEHAKYLCSFCDRGFPYPSNLKFHIVSVHGQAAYGFTCEVCGKVLKSKQVLENHLLIHTGERPHVCEVCGKTFIQLAHLKVHMYQHTEKPLQCQYCSKRYVFRTDLEAHVRTHTGEKPYACSKCGKKFHNRINMHRHYLLHSGIRRRPKEKLMEIS